MKQQAPLWIGRHGIKVFNERASLGKIEKLKKQPEFGKLVFLDTKLLKEDIAFQRTPPINAHVKDIAGSFESKAFGVIIVSKRINGDYIIIDGGHRRTVAGLLGIEKLPCCVLTGLKQAEEAKMFRYFNEWRRGVSAVDAFKAAVTSGDPDAVAIEKVVRSLGLEITTKDKDNGIKCVKRLISAHKVLGTQRFEEMLTLCGTCWTTARDEEYRYRIWTIDAVTRLMLFEADNKELLEKRRVSIDSFLSRRNLKTDCESAHSQNNLASGTKSVGIFLFKIWRGEILGRA